ncbi:thioesterase II family protein [Streptomyces mauvecolor]|uniref:Thioesterase II family protein n=1 Tax=Streptomyces mauvecolor TaxID=58345 RepID=A0ABV9UYK8_9ACTN
MTPDRRPVPWFPGTGIGTGAALPLICFPHAGGTPSLFRDWQASLGDGVRVVPVLLPGRGVRLGETPYATMAALVTAVVDALLDRGLTDGGYALFGHSMGALVAYETCCGLRRRGLAEPRHLYVAASRAPQLPAGRRDHLLDERQLWDSLRELGGIDGGSAVADGYWERRLPALRADLAACENYRSAPRDPLRCPVTAFSTEGDPVAPPDAVAAWRDVTSGPFRSRHLPGGHFFLTGPSRGRALHEIRAGLAPTGRPPVLTAQRNGSWT